MSKRTERIIKLYLARKQAEAAYEAEIAKLKRAGARKYNSRSGSIIVTRGERVTVDYPGMLKHMGVKVRPATVRKFENRTNYLQANVVPKGE